MATYDKESRIFIPMMPTLSQMSLAKVAIGLYTEFGTSNLWTVYSEMEPGTEPEFEGMGAIKCPLLRERVKEKLLPIPTNLRKRVLEIFDRVVNDVYVWRKCHEAHRLDETKYTLFWRSDGTVDRMKTAQEIVQNQNVHIIARFEIACIYCLESSVKNLYATLDADGEAFASEITSHRRFNGMVYFWIKWLNEGPRTQVPWTRGAHGNFQRIEYFRSSLSPRFYPLFRELTPRDRRKCFRNLKYADIDDFRSCLYIMSNEEQKEIIELYTWKVLRMHVELPLASFFLQIAEKSWEFLSEDSFTHLLELLILNLHVKHFDYEDLAAEFWKRCPDHFREKAKYYVFSKGTKTFIEDMKEKKTDYNHRVRVKEF